MLTRKQLAEKYGVTETSLSRGMIELRRYHIIDIEYGEINKGYESRLPAKTRFLGLYDWDKFQDGLKQLAVKHGKKKVNQARDYAKVVSRECDLKSIEDIIGFMDTYGARRVRRAFWKTEQKAMDNPKRTFKYVVGILQTPGDIRKSGKK